MTFVFEIQPVWASINPRHGKGKGKAIYARTLETLGMMVVSQRHENRWGTLGGRLGVIIDVYWADERGGDVDACCKCVLDALQAGRAVVNDKCFATMVANRRIDKARPRIEVRIAEQVEGT